jgi:hypothetical protein
MIVSVWVGNTSAAHRPAQGKDCQYFSETGHFVCDEFLDFFETRGGLEIFGYPLTEAFNDPTRGLWVQYFQCARMEKHPDNPEPYRVLLGLLADEMDHNFPPVRSDRIPASNSSLHHYFPETGHVVSYAFLAYFREHGGVDIFGYPRSEFMYEDGCTVQYFQRARMEWHPESVSGPQMRLTNLGEAYVERFGVPGNYDDPRTPPGAVGADALTPAPGLVTKLKVSASVRHIIAEQGGRQTVFVYVTDQRQQPVPGVGVAITVRYPSGDVRYECPSTDASGFTMHSFDILSSLPGKNVVIDVAATYGSLSETTQTFFLPWW